MKKIISILLVAAMLFTLSPVVFANEGDLDKLTENVTKDELVEDNKLDNDTKAEPVAFDIWINGVQLSSDVFQIKDVDDDKVIATYSSSDNVLTLTDAALLGGVVDGVLTGIVSKLDSLTINVNGSCDVTLVGNNDDETYSTICGISGSNITLVFAEGSTLSISTTKNNKTSAAAFDNNPVLTNGRFKDSRLFNAESVELDYYIDTGDITTLSFDPANVILDNDGGTPATDTVSLTEGEAMTSLSSKLPSKNGYLFGGYFASKGGQGTQYYDDKGEGTLPGKIWDGSSTKLYAKWTPISYTIKYDPNDGVGSMNSSTFQYDDVSQTLSKNTFTKVGYLFIGWAKSPTASEIEYYDEQRKPNVTNENNKEVTLYALWTPIVYAIQYNLDGGSKGSDNPSTAIFDEVLDVISPTKTGCTFLGWMLVDGDYDTAQYGSSADKVSTKITISTECKGGETHTYFKNLSSTNLSTVTLKAIWQYKITVSVLSSNGTVKYTKNGTTADLPSTKIIEAKSSDLISITATPSSSYYAKIYSFNDVDGKTYVNSNKGTACSTGNLKADFIASNPTIKVTFTSNPPTGDSFDPLLWVIAMASATAGAAITIAKKKAHK